MGFTMAGSAFLYNLMPILVTVHALQFAMFARINLLTAVLIFMTAAAECRGDILCQFRRKRSMVLMTLEAVAILHGIGMPVMALQAAETLAMAGMTLVTFHLGMGGWKTLHLFTRSGMTAEADGTQVFY